MPELTNTMTMALADLDLADLDVSDLADVHVVRDSVALPETAASIPHSCGSCSCSWGDPTGPFKL